MEHTNFFETLKEAEMRLKGTIILYDGDPYYVIAVTDHKQDGVFRLYLDPVSSENMTVQNFTLPGSEMAGGGVSYGQLLDNFMDANKNAPMIRKKMNSPLFNKFRPFPLGMCNLGKHVYFLERRPARKTEQGLITQMLDIEDIKVMADSGKGKVPHHCFSMFNNDFRACVKGEYPTAASCLAALKNPKVRNNAAAFHREFAFVRGPLDTLYLAYRDQVVGLLPSDDFSSVRLGKKYAYTREVVQGLNLFQTIEA
jgi:hypothetical protein